MELLPFTGQSAELYYLACCSTIQYLEIKLLCRVIVQQLEAASSHLHLPKLTLADRRLMALTHGSGHAIAQTAFLYFRSGTLLLGV